MHIWPSSSIRESFKSSYLRKLERNLQRMKRDKKSSAEQTLLENKNQSDPVDVEASSSESHGGVLSFLHDLSIILSCCYCCFCCGACVRDK